ncbi:MAG: 15-cis-phytoene synthase [Miltoncostaeaceae bacterium]|nr:15-cis-phytoene synthase [Miltoncostaeaceae bacterium]
MTVLEPRVAEAYERCREITRSEARNFYYGFVFLPPPRRAGIYAAYAFSRRCDDSVDGDDPLDCKLAALAARRAELDACYRDDPIGEDPVLIALADAVRRFAIPRAHLEHLLEGIEWDLTVRRYPDFPALEAYCDRVAGAVGLVSLHVFGFGDEAAPGHARELGVALQLVNIMRDVGEDAARGRIYLPADEMAAHGVTEEEVLRGQATTRFRALMRDQGARAHGFFGRGELLLPLLDRRARLCVAMLAGIYLEILERIEERDYDVFGSRVALSTPRKLALMGSRTLSALTLRA